MASPLLAVACPGAVAPIACPRVARAQSRTTSEHGQRRSHHGRADYFPQREPTRACAAAGAACAAALPHARRLPLRDGVLIVTPSPWGRNGFDGGEKANVACRGSCPPRKNEQDCLTADNNYALAA